MAEITEFGAQELKNKTIISPVIQGVVDSGTGLTFGKINAGATNVTTLGASGAVVLASTLGVIGNTNVATFGASGVANFNSNVGIVGTFKIGAAMTYYTNAELSTNGLALNANFLLPIIDSLGATYYILCSNAKW